MARVTDVVGPHNASPVTGGAPHPRDDTSAEHGPESYRAGKDGVTAAFLPACRNPRVAN